MSDEHYDIPLPEIVEMTSEEDDWFDTVMNTMIVSGRRCNCGHDGLAWSWHSDTCAAAAEAMRDYARELHRKLWEERDHRDRV